MVTTRQTGEKKKPKALVMRFMFTLMWDLALKYNLLKYVSLNTI